MNPRDFRTRRRVAPAQSGQGLALHCAERVAQSVDRRMPEAGAIADWLGQNGAGLGLPEMELPDDAPLIRGKRTVGVPAPAWRRVLSAISTAVSALPEPGGAPADLWVDALGDRLGYDSLERAILSLAIHYQLDERVERLVDGLCIARGNPTQLSTDPALLGLLLAAEPAEVETRLQPTATLRASGILRVDRDGTLEPIHPLRRLVRSATAPRADLYDQLLGTISGTPLPWDAFEHLGPQATIAADLLRAAVAGRETGINILLYGPPGTGKTSFASTLAAQVGARLRPITEEDSWGGEPSRHERLSGLRLAQRLARPGETLLLFDEAEDVFLQRSVDHDELVFTSRVFMHRLLETNPTPVIWTANDIGMIGPASLRRMTMCLELGVPGVAVRARLWRRMGVTEGVALDDADAARLARLVPAAPAVAGTALRATRLAGGDAGTARRIVEGIARAVAGGHLPAPEPEADSAYDPALLNADQDLTALADNLLRPGATRAVSILLSGPSGTGKSAWVHHLAARMGLEVLQKRASDLLGPFVGETEQRIAAAFAQARYEGAFLLFDEADTLLAERGNAVRTWEASQVNEMLTWMEQHPLPFACTTNLPDKLDLASLRRFLVKVRLEWLTAAQARLAFTRFYSLDAPPQLDDLRTLTPADFALVRRRAALTGTAPDAENLLSLLEAESANRAGGRSRLGFGA